MISKRDIDNMKLISKLYFEEEKQTDIIASLDKFDDVYNSLKDITQSINFKLEKENLKLNKVETMITVLMVSNIFPIIIPFIGVPQISRIIYNFVPILISLYILFYIRGES